MNCPVDNTPLAMSERQGVEIDYCPTCRGVWLDRGELDKIIERAERELEPVAADRERRDDEREQWEDERGDPSRHGGKRKKRRGSFLSEMFEGGGD